VAIIQQDQQQQETMNTLSPQQTQQQSQGQQQTPQVQSAGQSAQIGGTTSPVVAGSTQTKSPSSGLFTNLNKFFAANQNAGQQLASNIGNKAQTQAQDVGNAITSKLGEYQQAGQTAQQNIQNAQTAGQNIISGITSGTNTAPTADQIAQYQAAAKGQTLAGTSLANLGSFTPPTQQMQKLQQAAQQVNTPSGTFNLLRNYFATPQKQYSTGSQALDTAFLRSSPDSTKNLSSTLQGINQNLGQQYNTAQQTAAKESSDVAAANTAMAKSLGTANTAAQEDITKNIADQVSAAQTEAANTRAALQSAIASGNLYSLPADIQQKLGLTQSQQQAQDLYNKTINPILAGQDKYVSPEDLQAAQQWFGLASLGKGNIQGLSNYITDPNMSSAEMTSRLASSDQLSKLNALNQLAGTNQTAITTPSLVGQGIQGAGGITLNTQAAINAMNPIAQNIIEQSKSGVGQNMANTHDRYVQSLTEQGISPEDAEKQWSNQDLRTQVVEGEQEAYRRQAIENMQRMLSGQATWYGNNAQPNADISKQYQSEYGNY
jgi:hypothetical protein